MNNTISISFSNREVSSLSDNYWVVISQCVNFAEDVISAEDATDLVNAAFEIEPCDSDNYSVGGEEAPLDSEGALEVPTSVDDFYEKASNILEMPSCSMFPDGGYETYVCVYISHLNDSNYKLVLSNGNILETEVVDEEVSGAIKLDSATYTFEKPIFSDFEASVPVVDIKGSTVLFGADSGSVTVSYKSRYYKVKVRVNGTSTPSFSTSTGLPDAEECSVLCFYKNTVASLELQPPEVDPFNDPNTISTICGEVHYGINLPKDNVSCYKIINAVIRCSCSGEEVDRVTEEITVECPEWADYFCPGNETDCRKLLGSETYTAGYQYCDGEEDTELSDPFYYEETCCNFPSISLPRCKESYKVYFGGKGIKGGVEAAKSKYGEDAVFIAVSPRGGICGTTTIRQDVTAKNCCDEVSPLYFRNEDHPTVIADYSSAMFLVTGGMPPFKWRAPDNTYFDVAGLQERVVETTGRYVILHTEDICGTLKLIVEDSCDQTAEAYFRATDGHWDTAEYRYWKYSCFSWNCPPHKDPDLECTFSGTVDLPPLDPSNIVGSSITDDSWSLSVMHGKYRFTEKGGTQFNFPLDGNVSSECSSVLCNRSRKSDYPWPPCLGVPGSPYIEPTCALQEDDECVKIVNGVRCCFNCGDYWYSWLQRYGVNTCGSATYNKGSVVYSRRWEEWKC